MTKTNDAREAVRAGLRDWQTGPVDKLLAKNPERRESFHTLSGLVRERLYTPADGSGEPYLERLGFPGDLPYTRGVQPTMYRGRLWTMRQYAGFGTAAETNERFRFLLDQGQTGLSVAFDLPTQMGYDPDHPMAFGEVGKVGVSIASLGDMRQLFDGIPLAKVSTSMTINSTAAVLLAMYVALAEEQGADVSALRGTIQNDLLKEYVARGTYIYPPRPSLRIITDIFVHCKEQLPRFNTISISGYHIREAGSTAVQEIAFTLAHGIAYVQAAIDVGLEVDAFAGRLSFFFACHNDFLEEVAKFRAARRLWARIMQERFGASDPRSCALRFHTQTCGHTLAAQQPLNNVVRVTLQALAAVLGGTQSLHTNSFDEALALPSADAVRIALRTQQIIAHESGVADIVDPLGGAFAIEKLTDQLEAEAEALIARIDEIGGAVKAVEEGFMQRAIADSAYDYQKRIESGDELIVGVNRFQVEEDIQPQLLRVSQEVGEEAARKVRELREKRNAKRAGAALQAVGRAARSDENLFGPILEAVKADCTLGEIADALREVFGEYREA
ncbi:MAG: methylmalonyl-CoA mutase family protein [Deltaproteobacteria bacterium]|nr:methylmalonyl-CoA mutase family protein [Deltaproteobacteria bacterium]